MKDCRACPDLSAPSSRPRGRSPAKRGEARDLPPQAAFLAMTITNMEELIKTFHIDWKLLIAQLINFGIVFFVIWRFALRPLNKVMDRRGKEIAKSLEDARKIETNLAKSEKEREEKILTAKKEAQEIIEASRNQGKQQGQELIESAKREVQTVIAAAKEQIAGEKDKMLKEVKAEVSQLVVLTTTKVLTEVLDENLDAKMIENSLKKMKNQVR